MGTFWVAARDGLELKTRVEQHAPRCHLDMVSRDRELRKGHTAAGAPDDHAATILRRPVRSSLQDIKANLIPERSQGAKYELDDAVRDHLSFLWTWLVDLQLVV